LIGYFPKPMRGLFGDLGLSPGQDRLFGIVTAMAEETAVMGSGQILFLSADSGCGTSHLLTAVGAELGDRDFRVGIGRLAGHADDQNDSEALRAQALMASALSLASTFDPALSLVAAIAGVSAAAAQVLQRGHDDEPGDLLPRVLRAAAAEEPDRPLVCLIDDADWLNGAWWTELQFSFAREILERLPLLLVVAVRTTGLGSDGAIGDQPAARTEQSLVGRGMAESVALDPLTGEELGGWLDLKPREAVRGLFELTGGRTGDVAELCQAWLAQGAMVQEKNGLWLEVPDVLVDGGAADLASRLTQLAGDEARAHGDLLREALAFGALEGRAFTAAAVEAALDRDDELVEDLLDELVAETPAAGILLPPTAVEIDGLVQHETRTLWQFEFTNRTLWRAAQARLSDVPVVAAAGRMLEAVVEVFGGERPENLPSLIRLADLAGQPGTASHYRALLTGPDEAVFKAQADLLLAVDHEDWTTADYRDAAYVLADAANELAWRRDPALLDCTREGVRFAERAGQIGRHAHASVLASEAHVLRMADENEQAEAKLRVAKEIVERGSPELYGQILRLLAEVLRDMEGPIDERKALLQEALRIFEGSRHLGEEATIYWNLANIAAKAERDFARGRELNEKALHKARGSFNKKAEMLMMVQRANIELVDGRLELAREFCEEALRYETATGHTDGRARCLVMLARIELEAKNYETAWKVGQSGLALLHELGTARWDARIFHVLGDIAVALGNRAEGRSLLEDALVILERRDDGGQLSEVEGKLHDLASWPEE
jgi:hypothetical protein